MKFLFILQYESFVRTLAPVVLRLRKEGHECSVFFYKKGTERNWIIPELVQKYAVLKAETTGFFRTLVEIRKKPDLLIIGTVGARLIPRLTRFIRNRKLSIKIATGYAGALLNNHEKGFLKGVRRRAGSDLIWTPGECALDKIIKTGFIDTKKTVLSATGIPSMDRLYHQYEPGKSDKNLILFIEQPTFPESREDRLDLIKKLVELARHNSDKKVVIKPRFSSLVAHTHRPKFHLPDLLDKIQDKPENIEISNRQLLDLYPQTAYALTISSTAGLEAVCLGIPTYFISDYCGNENRFGSLDFKGLNTVMNLSDIIDGHLKTPDFDQAFKFLLFDGNSTERLSELFISTVVE